MVLQAFSEVEQGRHVELFTFLRRDFLNLGEENLEVRWQDRNKGVGERPVNKQ